MVIIAEDFSDGGDEEKSVLHILTSTSAQTSTSLTAGSSARWENSSMDLEVVVLVAEEVVVLVVVVETYLTLLWHM